MMDVERESVGHLHGIYTVVVGLALTEAITKLIKPDTASFPPIHCELAPYFFAFLFTLVPIYQGNLRTC
jgi:hypothetical protein